jgi:hypothetical protein
LVPWQLAQAAAQLRTCAALGAWAWASPDNMNTLVANTALETFMSAPQKNNEPTCPDQGRR